MKTIFLLAAMALTLNLRADPGTNEIVGVDKLRLGDKLSDKIKLQTDSDSLHAFTCQYTNHPPFKNLNLFVDADRRIYRIKLDSGWESGEEMYWKTIYDQLTALYGYGVFLRDKGFCRVTWEQPNRRLIFDSEGDEREFTLTYEVIDAAKKADAKFDAWQKEQIKKSASGL